MEILPNGTTIQIAPGTFPLGTDSVQLAAFIKLPKNAKVLDLGSGCGTLGLMLCDRDAGCQVTGVELDVTAHEAALENIARNGLQERLCSICADLRSIHSIFPAGVFSCCISNPPYFSGGPASADTPLARREDTCTPDELFAAAAWAVRFGGDFFLVHRPERLAELCAQASRHGFEAKRLRLLRHQPGAPVNLILLQFRKGAKPGLQWEEHYIL